MARGINGFPYNSATISRTSFANIEEHYNYLQNFLNEHPELVTTTPVHIERFDYEDDRYINHISITYSDDCDNRQYILPSGECINSRFWSWKTDDDIERLVAISKLNLPDNDLYGLSKEEIYDYIDSLIYN